jgi:hypothetical protein
MSQIVVYRGLHNRRILVPKKKPENKLPDSFVQEAFSCNRLREEMIKRATNKGGEILRTR